MFILSLAVNPWRWWSGIVYVVYLIISLHACVQALQFSEALSIIELQRVLLEMEDFLLNKNSHRDPQVPLDLKVLLRGPTNMNGMSNHMARTRSVSSRDTMIPIDLKVMT